MSASATTLVIGQIQPNHVTDRRVLNAFLEIPRERFVPDPLKSVAYIDEDVEIKAKRYLLEPVVLARLINLAKIKSSDTVLDIGCGTGYSSAVLSKLSSLVVALEEDSELADLANANLQRLGIDSVLVVCAALNQGYARQAPYQVILFNGAVEQLPSAILNQLDEKGRLVCVRTLDGMTGQGILMKKNNGKIITEELFDATVPLLPGFQKTKGFVFLDE